MKFVMPEEGLNRCVVCDYSDDKTRFIFDKLSDGLICQECNSVFQQEKWSRYTGPLGSAADVATMLGELEERIPGLFSGPVCPKGDLLCGCTFESGCKALDRAAAGVRVMV
jgi:hypothetical protein